MVLHEVWYFVFILLYALANVQRQACIWESFIMTEALVICGPECVHKTKQQTVPFSDL